MMATIVLHKETGKKYVLIGTGLGAFKATRPSFFGGNLFPNEEEGEIPVTALSDENGKITWIYTSELEVLEVDGKKIKEFFI